jgi:hypothetical protein
MVRAASREQQGPHQAQESDEPSQIDLGAG